MSIATAIAMQRCPEKGGGRLPRPKVVVQNADDDTEFAIQGKTQDPGRPVQTPRLKYHGDRRKTEMAKEYPGPRYHRPG
ncbi:hypothetical protein [Cereibacter ovatus]|uniref:hypothetical protein n=1 Tax=Cereibacter ovatus TaxID=439529 RepID=UPI001143A613|nr:hypothetical protein [Cereibacter ovatus]